MRSTAMRPNKSYPRTGRPRTPKITLCVAAPTFAATSGGDGILWRVTVPIMSSSSSSSSDDSLTQSTLGSSSTWHQSIPQGQPVLLGSAGFVADAMTASQSVSRSERRRNALCMHYGLRRGFPSGGLEFIPSRENFRVSREIGTIDSQADNVGIVIV